MYIPELQWAELDGTKCCEQEQGFGILHWLVPGCVAGVG